MTNTCITLPMQAYFFTTGCSNSECKHMCVSSKVSAHFYVCVRARKQEGRVGRFITLRKAISLELMSDVMTAAKPH